MEKELTKEAIENLRTILKTPPVKSDGSVDPKLVEQHRLAAMDILQALDDRFKPQLKETTIQNTINFTDLENKRNKKLKVYEQENPKTIEGKVRK